MPKPPSWNEIRAGAAAFAARWDGETKENAEAQTFWNEFLAIFGQDRRRVATFEQRAQRHSTGGRGRIDLLWPGTLAAEHKSTGKSLADAEAQALDYLDSLDDESLPNYVIASDFAHFRLLDLSSGESAVEFALSDLVKEIDRFGFIAGYTQRKFSSQQEEQANIEAARLMARLYEQLAAAGYEGHEASVLLTRLLFLLFGDDTGMWQKGLFAEFLDTRTAPDGSDLGPQLAYLFQILDKREDRRPANADELLRRFPHVNGGLFHDRLDIPSFDRDMRDELVAASNFDWGSISPAIFGSLFQAVKSKEARRELGEHYTTELNILRVIEPLFLDGLRAEFKAAYDSERKLKNLRERMGRLRFIDPACGCGNFLVVAYREMRALELGILKRLRDLTGEEQLSLDPTLGLKVSLDSFYGIEVEEWPARIAETAMFLVDHQANLALSHEFGQMPDRLPIEVAATIANVNALRTDWSTVLPCSDNVLVLGNPPFVGSRMETDDQRADQDLVWAGNKRRGTLDFVTNWHKRAAEYMAGTQARAAFVSTNSITQGEQPAVLWKELWAHGMRIDFAHRTFRWTSEAPSAAAVHVVIIGFTAASKPGRRPLWFYPDIAGDGLVTQASSINPYLLDGEDIVVASRQEPLVAGVPPLIFGSMPRDGGHLSKITPEEAADIQANDLPASKYLHRLIGAEELISGGERWCLWDVDDPNDIASSSFLTQRLAGVREMRRASKADSTRAAAATPGRFVQRAQPSVPYLAVPGVSSESREYLPTAFFGPEVIASNALLFVPGADLTLFGIMSSRVFTAWNRTVSGRLKSDCRISQEITYNNFPWLTGNDPKSAAIAAAGEAVLDCRAQFPNSTLAVLYKALSMPPALSAAHAALDKAVLAAYGLPGNATEAAIAVALLKKYKALCDANTLPGVDGPKAKRTRRA